MEDLEEIKPPEPPEEEPLPQEPEEKPQQVAMDVPKEDLIRFPEPKVAPANKVVEEVASQEELKDPNKTPARITLKGSPTGTSVARGEFGSKKQDGGINLLCSFLSFPPIYFLYEISDSLICNIYSKIHKLFIPTSKQKKKLMPDFF